MIHIFIYKSRCYAFSVSSGFFFVIDVVLSVIEPVEMTVISNFYILKKIKKKHKKNENQCWHKTGKVIYSFSPSHDSVAQKQKLFDISGKERKTEQNKVRTGRGPE